MQLTLLTIQEFIGRFHPVLVHLPIGILVLAFILQCIERFGKKKNFHESITIALLAGMIGAILSCVTGFLLSQSGDYDADAVNWHQWMGIITAVFSIVLYYGYRKRDKDTWQWPGMIFLFILIVITGHLGGNLTHGSGYLTQPLGSDVEEAEERKPIADVQQAMAYAEIIQPVLKSKCYSCHNAEKKKGGLRMDDTTLLLKGGKDGLAIKAGSIDESGMIKRILLSPEDEDHMPPKEKPQLTESEVKLLHWWIASGASFNKKVKDLEQPDNIKTTLLDLQKAPEVKALPDLPLGEVGKADDAAIKKLQDKGIVVMPVAQNSNYLSLNFVIADSVNMETIKLLQSVKEQLAWLKLGNTPVGDSALAIIGQCKNLTRLQLDNTRITDNGLDQLKNLQELRYLNLVGTKVTAAGVKKLVTLKNLASLYLYQTGITPSDWAALKQAFPKTQLDSGGYKVPTLESDTTVLKYIPPKN